MSEKEALEQALQHLHTAHPNGPQAVAEELQSATALVDKVKAKLREAFTTIKALTTELERYEAPPLSRYHHE